MYEFQKNTNINVKIILDTGNFSDDYFRRSLKNAYCKIKRAEVPGATRINLQPNEHLLFCKVFKNVSFSF